MMIYLAGPIRGVPQLNWPAFKAAAERLKADGHGVYSPLHQIVSLVGEEAVLANETGNEDQILKEARRSRRKAFEQNLSWICTVVGAVVVLPGWERSMGALAEVAVAEALGLPVGLASRFASE